MCRGRVFAGIGKSREVFPMFFQLFPSFSKFSGVLGSGFGAKTALVLEKRGKRGMGPKGTCIDGDEWRSARVEWVAARGKQSQRRRGAEDATETEALRDAAWRRVGVRGEGF